MGIIRSGNEDPVELRKLLAIEETTTSKSERPVNHSRLRSQYLLARDRWSLRHSEELFEMSDYNSVKEGLALFAEDKTGLRKFRDEKIEAKRKKVQVRRLAHFASESCILTWGLRFTRNALRWMFGCSTVKLLVPTSYRKSAKCD